MALDVMPESQSDENRDLSILDDRETETKKEPPKEKTPPAEELTEELTEEEAEETTEEIEEEDKQLQELDQKVTRPSFKEIQEKHPEIFKEFPELRDVYHRDAVTYGATGLFTNVEEAKGATEKSQRLDAVEDAISKGDFEGVLKTLDDKDLENLSSDFMRSIHAINPKFYYAASGPIFADMLNAAMKRAERIKSDNFKNSILNICEFLYGKAELPKLKQRETDPRVEEERRVLQEEKDRILFREASNFHNSTNKIIEKRINQIILEGLDPSNEVPDFTKKAIVSEVMNRIADIVRKDEPFKQNLKGMFARAEKQGFPIELKSQIVSAYLGRVKSLISSLKSQVKAEALGKRTRPAGPRRLEPSKEETSLRKVSSTREVDPKKVNWRETSDDDILAEDGKIVLKK